MSSPQPHQLLFLDSKGQKQKISYATLLQRMGLAPWDGHKPRQEVAQVETKESTVHFYLGDILHTLSEVALLTSPPLLLHNSSFLMTCTQEDLGLIANGAVLIDKGRILWAGPKSSLPFANLPANTQHIDVKGALITPGLVDSHAHPLFAGNRADEFAMRAKGAGYLEIAQAGGGINATVTPTRNATFDELLQRTTARLHTALLAGTTTMEAKSGYDLRAEGELRLLRVAAEASNAHPMTLSPTLLGAHVLPAEYKSNRDAYVDLVIQEMIPNASSDNLANAVDVYCDEGAFTKEETERILRAAKAEGLAVKAHIGQFCDLGAAQLLADLGALSGDHLEQVSPEGIAAMAKAGVIATMLPVACVQLKMAPPPVGKFRKAGVKMALASDLNPGSSHCETLAVPMWLATTHFGMTVEEAWLGVTRHGALALGRGDIGIIGPGAKADLVVWDAEVPGEIPYSFGKNRAGTIIVNGMIIHRKDS